MEKEIFEKTEQYKSRDGKYYDTYGEMIAADRILDKSMPEVFKSDKTGQKYDSLAEMLRAEAEYDRAERERVEAKDFKLKENLLKKDPFINIDVDDYKTKK